MAKISLSKLFKLQIHNLEKIESIKVTRAFRRVERMIDEIQNHYFPIEQMTIRIRVTKNTTVIFKVLPSIEKIIVKKILPNKPR